MEISVKQINELRDAKEKAYEKLNELSREFNDIAAKLQTGLLSSREELKLEKRLAEIMKKLTKEEIRVKSFWEKVRERHNIHYPWQLDCLVSYAEDLKLPVEAVVKFDF